MVKDGNEIRFRVPLIVTDAGLLLTETVPLSVVGNASPIRKSAVPEDRLTLVVSSYVFSSTTLAPEDADWT